MCEWGDIHSVIHCNVHTLLYKFLPVRFNEKLLELIIVFRSNRGARAVCRLNVALVLSSPSTLRQSRLLDARAVRAIYSKQPSNYSLALLLVTWSIEQIEKYCRQEFICSTFCSLASAHCPTHVSPSIAACVCVCATKVIVRLSYEYIRTTSKYIAFHRHCLYTLKFMF